MTETISILSVAGAFLAALIIQTISMLQAQKRQLEAFSSMFQGLLKHAGQPAPVQATWTASQGPAQPAENTTVEVPAGAPPEQPTQAIRCSTCGDLMTVLQCEASEQGTILQLHCPSCRLTSYHQA